MKTTTSDGLAREAPMIHYRMVSEPTVGTEGIPPLTNARRPAILVWLSWAVLGVVMVVWAVVGALVWVPLLLRGMVRFSLALVQATLDREPPTEAAATLRGAVDFYRRGFVMAADALHGRTPEPTGRTRPVRTRRLLREFAWVAVVWYALLAALGVVWSPVEIGQWIVALPWSGWAVGVGAWIVEPFV
jgi:hypothetical protein